MRPRKFTEPDTIASIKPNKMLVRIGSGGPNRLVLFKIDSNIGRDLHTMRLSPGLRQTVKPLFAVRWNLIVQRRPLPARCQPAGEAEAGSAGEQPAKE